MTTSSLQPSSNDLELAATLVRLLGLPADPFAETAVAAAIRLHVLRETIDLQAELDEARQFIGNPRP